MPLSGSDEFPKTKMIIFENLSQDFGGEFVVSVLRAFESTNCR